MKSGLPPAAAVILARSSSATPCPIRVVASSRLSGSSRIVTGQVGRLSSNSGRAMQSSRIGEPLESSATCSMRSRNVSSPHWMSSNRTTSGACSSSSLRNAQPISSAEVPVAVSPSSERMAAAAAGSDGSASSCFTTSTTGQYVIPVAVGETATANNPSVDRPERLCHEPRLAEARVTDDRDELAALLRRRPVPRLDHQLELPPTPDERHVVAPLGRRARSEQAGSTGRARACPSTPTARPTPHRQRHRRATASPPRSRPLPAPPRVATAPPRSAHPPSRGAPPFRSPPRPSPRRYVPRSRARGTRPASRPPRGRPATHRPRAPQAPRTPPPRRPR